MDGEDEKFAHGANGTITTGTCKTARRRRIASHCEFAPHRMLRRTLRAYGAHFHQERNHQGLGNVLIMPDAPSKHRGGLVIRRPRLGGLLNYYERAAA